MKLHSANQLTRRCPGPFAVFPGRDGVDDTFDVFCLTTEQHIVSTYYWHEQAWEYCVLPVSVQKALAACASEG